LLAVDGTIAAIAIADVLTLPILWKRA